MKLSREKVVHLSHVLVDVLDKAEDASEDFTVKEEEQPLRHAMVEAMLSFLAREEACVLRAREKVLAIRRGIPEGSAEFDALYQQFYREEMDRLRKVR